MFQISSEMLAALKNALAPQHELAMNGPQIYNAGICGECSGTCKNSCRGDCKGSCKGGCTRSCKGHSR